MEINPIAVILVHMDSKGDRLLYRYPYQMHSASIPVKAAPETKKRNPYAANNADELQPQQPPNINICGTTKGIILGNTTGIGINHNIIINGLPTGPCGNSGQMHNYADETLSALLAVKQPLCNQKFELKVNDVRFVSHPTLVQRKDQPQQQSQQQQTRQLNVTSNLINNIGASTFNNLTNTATIVPTISASTTSTTTSTTANAGPSKPVPQQMLINIVFALHAQASYSIVKCYHELSKRLGLALKVEEQRIGYLSDETVQMARTHDEISTQQLPIERALDLISERFSLAQALKAMYHDLCSTGILSTVLNQNLTLSFCLPQKAHQMHKKNSMVNPEAIDECLRSLKPYHGILLLVDFAELWDCVPPTAARLFLQLIEVYTPLTSLQSMAQEADLSLEHVNKLVSHLVYWAKATIIYPLCETNVYVIAPDAPLHTKSHLVEKFSTRFAGMSLFEVISDFSLPTSIGHLTTPLQQPARQGILAQMVLWMLQHHLLMQLHTYVQFMPSSVEEFEQNELCHQIGTNTIMHNMSGVSTGIEDIEMDPHIGIVDDVSETHIGSTNSLFNVDKDNISNEINTTTLLNMSSQPLPVPHHASRRSITEEHYSIGGSTASDNIIAQPSSSHKSNYSMTASMSTDNRDSIASIEDEEKIADLLQVFDEADRAAIRRIPASMQVDDLSLMVKLYQAGYFKSEHHLEEIMYFQSLRRSQLLQLLDKFREILIIYETEDPIYAVPA